MPGLTARSALKKATRKTRGYAAKNSGRVSAALTDDNESYAYGKITKCLGNKTFKLINTDKTEHLGHIRGKLPTIAIGDIVLLNIREYETRSGTDNQVYDITAKFSNKDIAKLLSSKSIPPWMASKSDNDEYDDLFDYSEETPDVNVDDL